MDGRPVWKLRPPTEEYHRAVLYRRSLALLETRVYLNDTWLALCKAPPHKIWGWAYITQMPLSLSGRGRAGPNPALPRPKLDEASSFTIRSAQ